MLDVNADLAGDVDGAFQPYGHAVNLELFEVFCARWGIDVAHESAVELIRLFESFTCVRDD
ncbi:MAG: hypothetical protein GY838_15185 [bacterium]|nr:hypothetical protein [bacterium]